MKRFFRDRVRGQIVRWPCGHGCGSLMIATAWSTGRAQTMPEKEAPDGTYTLHVYTDLLQVPTIVLTRLHSNYRALTKESFTLSLDGGPRFHPANVRLEGDDPITIAILLDLTTDESSMFNSFASAMSTLPAGVFSARDYISVYAYDCKLMRTTEDKPATPQELQASMVKVMTEGRGSARNGAKQSCWRNKRLYDAVARVSQDIGDLPGRRVVLVISDGADRQKHERLADCSALRGEQKRRDLRNPAGEDTDQDYKGLQRIRLQRRLADGGGIGFFRQVVRDVRWVGVGW